MRGRPKAELILTQAEREQLQAWTRRRKTSQALALRSRIVLECAKGRDNQSVAERLSVTPQTVSKWRGRFVRLRLDGLVDAPRAGAPRTVEDAVVEAVITRTLESTPKNATHWSTREMACEMGLSQSTIGRIWRAFGL
jgi:transposase